MPSKKKKTSHDRTLAHTDTRPFSREEQRREKNKKKQHVTYTLSDSLKTNK